MRTKKTTTHLYWGFAAVGALFAVSACQTEPSYLAEPVAEAVVPADSPQIFVERREGGVRINSLGGEIPSAQPAEPVGNEGMDEVR